MKDMQSLVSMFEELNMDDCVVIEGGGQRSGVVAGIITGGILIAFILFFYCPFCNKIVDTADAVGFEEGDPSTALCPDCGGSLDPVYEDDNTGC